MIDAILAKVFGTKNKREIKAMQPIIAAINDLEPRLQPLSDIDLAAKTIEFKEKLAQGAPLDDLLIGAPWRGSGEEVAQDRVVEEGLASVDEADGGKGARESDIHALRIVRLVEREAQISNDNRRAFQTLEPQKSFHNHIRTCQRVVRAYDAVSADLFTMDD